MLVNSNNKTVIVADNCSSVIPLESISAVNVLLPANELIIDGGRFHFSDTTELKDTFKALQAQLRCNTAPETRQWFWFSNGGVCLEKNEAAIVAVDLEMFFFTFALSRNVTWTCETLKETTVILSHLFNFVLSGKPILRWGVNTENVLSIEYKKESVVAEFRVDFSSQWVNYATVTNHLLRDLEERATLAKRQDEAVVVYKDNGIVVNNAVAEVKIFEDELSARVRISTADSVYYTHRLPHDENRGFYKEIVKTCFPADDNGSDLGN